MKFVEQEVMKGYRPPAVKDIAFEMFKNKQVGIEYLMTEKVLNAQHKAHGGLNVPFIGPNVLGDDLKESLEWLKSNDYLIERLEEGEYRGFVFATVVNLEAFLMDSTPKTDKRDWKLYTPLVRNSFNSWLPGYFFVSGEEQQIVGNGLQVLKQWAKTWQPRYFLIDQSVIQENAVNQAFPGEQNVSIFYCTWHCQRISVTA